MIYFNIFILLVLIVILITRPRVDFTADGEYVIYYWWRGKRREFII
jgi:hypothetical protein